MKRFSREVRQQATREELNLLAKAGLISQETYEAVTQAQAVYHQQQVLPQAQEPVKQVKPQKAVPQIKREPVVVPRKKISPQAVRERNISWLLSLGVILLLVGGLVLATSAWGLLANWMKTGLIAFVALLFFGLALFTMRVLKIPKTAFAFYILGSLFLPIVILSAGFFELFGAYFSFTGEGRFIYGAVGSLALIPVFSWLTHHLKSRLFVWFTYISLSFGASFLLAAFYLPVDGFYLGIMLFNALLIAFYYYFKDHPKLTYYTREFVGFIQANLVLSTVLMLIFYQNELMYGINLVLAAAIYFALIFVTNKKEYHFVFTALLVYGAYQFIEFSPLLEVDALAYALLGLLFLALPKFLSTEESLQKIFRYTSAAVSGTVFIYISFEAISLRMNEPSLILLLAYLIITLNFIFLARTVKERVITYLAPVFLIAASAEFVLVLQQALGYDAFIFSLFILLMMLYVGIGCYGRLSFFQVIKASTRDVTLVVMFLSLLYGVLFLSLWQVSTMFALLSLVALVMIRFEERSFYKTYAIGSLTHALALGFAVLFLLLAVENTPYLVLRAEYVVGASLVVLGASFAWRVLKRSLLSDQSFYVAQVFYAGGIALALLGDTNPISRFVMLLGGVAMAYLLYRKQGERLYAYGVSGLALATYIMFLDVIDYQFVFQSSLYDELQYVLGAVVLFGAGLLVKKRDPHMRNSFWVIAHAYLPFALLFSILSFANMMWAFLGATLLYGLSLVFIKGELKIKLLLYSGLTTFFLTISYAIAYFSLDIAYYYAFLLTSTVIALFWFFTERIWAQRLAYYLVPFSVLGLSVFSFAYPVTVSVLISLFLYLAGLLYVMYREKLDLFKIVPLLFGLNALASFGTQSAYSNGVVLMIVSGFALACFLTGFLIYPRVYEGVKLKEKPLLIDWYTIIGFVALFTTYSYIGEALWMKVLPGLLISCGLMLQQRRVPQLAAPWLVFAGIVYLLQPYYALLGHVAIPELITRELYLAPWLGYVLLLKRVLPETKKQIASYLQWGVLVIIAGILLRDAVVSPTVAEALLLGGLALTSVFVGVFYQLKAFFFIGSGVLLLNALLQTQAYWGNLPWWAYLLISGSLLIAVASYNEWHKQKTTDGKVTHLTKLKNKLMQIIKKWE